MFDLQEEQSGSRFNSGYCGWSSSFTADANERGYWKPLLLIPGMLLNPEQLIEDAEGEIAVSTAKLEKLD